MWLIALAVGAVAAVAAHLLAPNTPPPTAEFNGDEALAAESGTPYPELVRERSWTRWGWTRR